MLSNIYTSVSALYEGFVDSPVLAMRFATLSVWLGELCVLALLYYLFTRPVARAIKKHTDGSATKWDDHLLSKKMIRSLGLVGCTLAVYLTFPHAGSVFPQWAVLIEKICRFVFITSVFALSLNFIQALMDGSKAEDVNFPGILTLRTVARAVAVALYSLFILTLLLNKDVAVILSGLGAMTAILALVFRDTILSLVASVKLSSNKMLKHGDWISVPSYNADGVLEDVHLTAVTVRNWDGSKVTIPPYALISGGFQNNQIRVESMRRVSRVIPVDLGSIRFLSTDEIAELKSKGFASDTDMRRPQVNLTLFRRWLRTEIEEESTFLPHPHTMVREMAPTSKGLPVEIYFFSSATEWAKFEQIQADFIDYVIAMLPEFGLRLFQDPTGHDLNSLHQPAIPELADLPD